MASGAPMPLLAVLFFLLAAVCTAAGWRIGPWLTASGVAVLAGALTARGVRAGYWPLTSVYGFAMAFALTIGLAVLITGTSGRGRFRTAQGLALLLASSLLVYARLVLPPADRETQPLHPAMDSIWLPLHVGTSALAYGALAVAAASAVVWLRRSTGSAGDENATETDVAWLQDRAIAVGYPLLTLSMLLGMVWGQAAWGRYWDWDLKESWTFATWLIFTAHWHLRSRRGWRGRRLAWLALGGFCSVLFTLLGTGWLARAVGVQSLQPF